MTKTKERKMVKKCDRWIDLFAKDYILNSGIILKIRTKELTVGDAHLMMFAFLKQDLMRLEEHLNPKPKREIVYWCKLDKIYLKKNACFECIHISSKCNQKYRIVKI